jgi:hypothetical protein
MISALISLIFLCVLAGVIWWGAQQLLALVPMAEPFATLVRVLMVLILVVIVLYAAAQLLGLAGIHVNLPLLR